MLTRLQRRFARFDYDRKMRQVQAVRDRLLASATGARWRVVVQLNDHSQSEFWARGQLAPGDFVEAGADGTLVPASLVTSQRIIGVVVSVGIE
jgi:hypothetical protein